MQCIISYQQVLRSVLQNVNLYADDVINSHHIINGQELKNSVLAVCLCFGAP
jgi:5'(3')-deoxyribonucleotidase